MIRSGRSSLGVDWTVVLLYFALVIMGWFNIYAAVYDDSHTNIFDFSLNSGKQAMWIGISCFLALFIMLLDEKYYHILAYPLYWISIAVLLGVFVLGKEVNGAKAWYEFGSVRIQPTEFVKFTVSLAIARLMSSHSFNIHSKRSLANAFALLLIPVAIIILQNDTGSALVYGAFAFMLYREGLAGWVYSVSFLLLALFILSFLIEPLPLIILLFAVCVLAGGVMNRNWKATLIYAAGVALCSTGVYFLLNMVMEASLYVSIILSIALSVIGVAIYSFRKRIRNIAMLVVVFFGSLAFTHTIDYVFDEVLQPHQQTRILHLLGLESDLKGAGYNVNQSKIAIGSGGFSGKGFLNGTQTKYNFVPEQSTDFIFCTVGEEWGFIGSAVVTILFAALIMKLISMGERQEEAFGRIYCYCVASVFLFHFLVNIGMTIGLMPVIGIPLPFFSYGGSSLLAFTVMLFVAVKLDSAKKSHITRI